MTPPGNLTIVKIGGGEAINLDGIAEDLASLPDPVIVVHGANALRDRLAGQLGTPRRTITSAAGYSSVYSDDAAIDLLMLAYAGLANKRIVEALQRRGRNAIGLTGLDGRLIQGRRNQGIRVTEAGKTVMVRDRSGKPRDLNLPLLEMLLSAGYTPVLTVPLVDESGAAINAENDDVVALLAARLAPGRILQLIEAPGLLADPADPGSVIPRLTSLALGGLEAAAGGRFKRKLHAIGRAFEQGAALVQIGDGRTAHPIADLLAGAGTTITRESAA